MCCIGCKTLMYMILCKVIMWYIIFYSFHCEFSGVVCVLLSLSFLLLSLSFFKMMRFSGDRKSGRLNWYQSIRLSEYLGSGVVSILRERICNFYYIYYYIYIYFCLSIGLPVRVFQYGYRVDWGSSVYNTTTIGWNLYVRLEVYLSRL